MHVAVVGGGLAGLAVSVGLADVGWKVTLIEKRPAFDHQGSTLSLAVNGQKALREICPDALSTIL